MAKKSAAKNNGGKTLFPVENSSPCFPHLLIRASAGTGKTYQLSNRYLALLAAGVNPECILATTFTRKAAGEIFDRVLHRLAEAATSAKAAARLAEALQQSQTLDQTGFRQLLVNTLANQHRLRIGTLDSYFAQLASACALELGLPAGWRIGETHEDIDLQAEAIERVLEREQLQDLLALLHLLTKGETQRGVSQLIASTVGSLYSIFGQTTEEAWNRLPQTTPLTPDQLEATLAEAQKIVLPANKTVQKAWQNNVTAAEKGDWEEFIKGGIAKKSLEGETKFSSWEIPDEVQRIFQALLDHARSVLLKRLALQTEAIYKLLARFDAEYQHLKQERGLLRFDDVTLALARAEQEAAERMAFRLGGRMKHLLLDEFQDTSLTQWQVLRPLAQAITSQQGGNTSLFCVGDVKQAIYGWRGGLAEIFAALEQELTGLVNDQLVESRRSAQPIIDVVNQVFQNLTSHPSLDRLEAGVSAWQRAFPPHTTARKELEGYVTLETSPVAEDEEGNDHHNQYVVQRIIDLAMQAPGCSIGVLVRSNDMVARLIYLLRQRHVPASEEGGNPLTDSAAVNLLLSLLRLIDHPGDQTCRYHVAKSPLAPHLQLPWPCPSHVAAEVAQRLRRELLDEGYGPVIYRWARWLAPECNRRDLARLQQLVELAYNYQPRSTLRTADFIKLVLAEKVSDPQAASIRVMTIHQSKGLQFDIVVLPELEGEIPGQMDNFIVGRPGPTQPVNLVCRSGNEHVRSFFPDELRKLYEANYRQKIEEALCVLYVALTRPIHALHMIVKPAKETAKKIPKTSAGFLRATLAPDKPALAGKVLFEHGQAGWYQNWLELAGESAATTPPAPPPPPPPIVLAKKSRLPKRLERVAPSQLEGGNRFRLSEVFRESSAEMLAGTLFHAWFEQIEWLEHGQPDPEVLREVARRALEDIDYAGLDIGRRISDFQSMLKSTSVQRALSREAYRQSLQEEEPKRKKELANCEFCVYRERTFALQQDDHLLTGAMDRLVLQLVGGKPIGAQVIDFKTDDISQPGALTGRVEHYRPQMVAYCDAVARLYDLPRERVTARLVFVYGDREECVRL
jgi:ATP-dependent helicase/nuclease subunit A